MNNEIRVVDLGVVPRSGRAGLDRRLGNVPPGPVGRIGDSVFLMALYGPQLVDRWSWYIDKHHDALRANMRQYAASGHELLQGSVGCLGIKAQHLWHGTTNQREYQSRHRIIADLTAANTQLDSNGFVELVHAPKVRLAIADYWKRRKCNK